MHIEHSSALCARIEKVERTENLKTSASSLLLYGRFLRISLTLPYRLTFPSALQLSCHRLMQRVSQKKYYFRSRCRTRIKIPFSFSLDENLSWEIHHLIIFILFYVILLFYFILFCCIIFTLYYYYIIFTLYYFTIALL